MANIVDYVYWRGDLSFSASPFNELDNLVLSMTSYLDFSGIVPENFHAFYCPTLREAMELYERKTGGSSRLGLIIPDSTIEIMRAAAKSERFGRLHLCAYRSLLDHSLVMQFSAVTFLLPAKEVFIAYRGTDDTITGWKEDFNLCLEAPVPAELQAAVYLQEIAAMHDGTIRVGGHSKGGHLAVRAAADAVLSVQERITAVYSNDGPGFHAPFFESTGYRAIREKAFTYIPQSSIIGTLLEQDDERCFDICSTSTGPLQHNAVSWAVEPTGFVYLDGRSRFGSQSDEAISQWLNRTSQEERKLILENLFSVLDAPGVTTLTEFHASGLRSTQAVIRALRNQDPHTKKIILQIFRRIFLPETGNHDIN